MPNGVVLNADRLWRNQGLIVNGAFYRKPFGETMASFVLNNTKFLSALQSNYLSIFGDTRIASFELKPFR